jgi:hypothetical protein
MSRIAHAGTAFLAVFLACSTLTLTLTLGATAAGAVPCEDRVLNDWYDNGRIDRMYALECYDRAIETMPADLRDYTDATDVIRRALASALGAAEAGGKSRPGSTPEAAPAVDPSGTASVPIPLVFLGAMSLAVLAAGGLSYVSRRRRSSGS